MALRNEVRDTYSAAAAKFRDALELLGANASLKVAAKAGRPVGYFLRMELANSLLFSGDEGNIEDAAKIYSGLVSEFPRDPTAILRLARTKVRLMRSVQDVQDALDLCKKGVGLIAKDALTGDLHWLALAGYIQWGYTHWQLSVLAGKDGRAEDEIEAVKAALAVTRKAYAFWQKLQPQNQADETYRLYAHKTLSNIVFYLSELIKRDVDDAGVDEKAMLQAMDQLEQLQVPKYQEYYKTRDNLMHAYVAIGDLAKATELARENIAELKRIGEARVGRPIGGLDVDRVLTTEEAKNYHAASAFLTDQGGQR